MNVSYIAFTDRGYATARMLAAGFGGEASLCGSPMSLDDWTKTHFKKGEGLVFIGAAGIAVRAIAKYVGHKSTDPAVLVVDEAGKYVIPILSGHLGGANQLARRLSALCGGISVITTATDIRGVFSVDDWARCQNCAVHNPEKIKDAAKKSLSGESLRICSDWTVEGQPPAGIEISESDCDVLVSIRRRDVDALKLIPRIAVLGIGCRRGTGKDVIDKAVEKALLSSGLYYESICSVASIDLKADEPGLVDYCRDHGFEFCTYTPQELKSVTGDYSSSDFVESVTGVDNVCERAAVRCSGGELICGKTVYEGVTAAIAVKPYKPDWRVSDG